jgi:hypothetical protein
MDEEKKGQWRIDPMATFPYIRASNLDARL